MHATKVAWVGQTFALAKCNDSGESCGRKSRIRRSKEERKAMVESFIKRYQNSNNGSFPSLNLTHKEVGGSFYTVREIVREVIQENRVLGPPKLPPGEQNMDSFLEQYPLGSISVDPPHIHVIPSNETQILLDHHQNTNEEQVLRITHIPELHHWRLDNEKNVNGSTHATVHKEESEEPIYTESIVEKGVEGQKDEEKEEEACQAKISQISDDVVVEMFPLRPVSNTVYDLDRESSEKEVLAGVLEAMDIENMELETGSISLSNNNSAHDEMHLLDSSEIVDMKSEGDLAGPLPERNSILMDEKAEPTLESQNHSTTKESIAVDVKSSRDIEVEDTVPARNRPANVPNGIFVETLNNTTNSSPRQLTLDEANANQKKSDIQHGVTPEKKRSDLTLDRINLESWDVTSEKSARQEPNSLFAFMKPFMTAFIKFWSE